MTVNKALLLNVGVFEANLNVRKSKGAYSLNYQNTTNSVNYFAQDVEGGRGFTWQSLAAVPAVTMIRVTGGPVLATVSLGVLAGVRSVFEVVELQINQFLALDDNVQTVTISNQGSATVNVAITQG